jgi:hypothetical protein
VAAAIPVQAQHDLLYPGREKRTKVSNCPPQLHELRNRDVTPLEVEYLVRSSIAVESDPPFILAHVERQLGSVVEDLCGGNDRRIRHLELAEATERVADEAAPGEELGLGIHVLQLTPPALVIDVVRTTGLDPVGRSFQ